MNNINKKALLAVLLLTAAKPACAGFFTSRTSGGGLFSGDTVASTRRDLVCFVLNCSMKVIKHAYGPLRMYNLPHKAVYASYSLASEYPYLAVAIAAIILDRAVLRPCITTPIASGITKILSIFKKKSADTERSFVENATADQEETDQ